VVVERTGFTFKTQRERAWRGIFAQQPTYVGIVVPLGDGEFITSPPEDSAYAACNSEPCHAGSPRGKRSRTQISFPSIAFFTKKLLNIKALARFTGSNPRFNMPKKL